MPSGKLYNLLSASPAIYEIYSALLCWGAESFKIQLIDNFQLLFLWIKDYSFGDIKVGKFDIYLLLKNPVLIEYINVDSVNTIKRFQNIERHLLFFNC